jgi:hypothetical protein
MPHRGYRWGKPLSEEKRRHKADVFVIAASVPIAHVIRFNHLRYATPRAGHSHVTRLVHRSTNWVNGGPASFRLSALHGGEKSLDAAQIRFEVLRRIE